MRRISSSGWRREEGKLTPHAAKESCAFPPSQPALRSAGGKELTVVAIQWASFTDDQIVNYFRKWVKHNRPEQIPAPNEQGKKLNDWRVALHRVGVMRALHVATFADHRLPRVLKERGEKHCYASRTFALRKFGTLFPFLPDSEETFTHGWQCFA